MASKKYKVKEFTLADVIDHLTGIDDATCFLKCWKLWSDIGQQIPQEWLGDHPKATQWAVENEFIEDITPVHDWSGLKLRFSSSGNVLLNDGVSNKTLLIFFSNTGDVRKYVTADGGAGHFDARGRLIIDDGVGGA